MNADDTCLNRKKDNNCFKKTDSPYEGLWQWKVVYTKSVDLNHPVKVLTSIFDKYNTNVNLYLIPIKGLNCLAMTK